MKKFLVSVLIFTAILTMSGYAESSPGTTAVTMTATAVLAGAAGTRATGTATLTVPDHTKSPSGTSTIAMTATPSGTSTIAMTATPSGTSTIAMTETSSSTPTITMTPTAVFTGAVWTQAAGKAGFSGRAWPGSIVYDNKMWVIAGGISAMNDVWNSNDGTTWTQVTHTAGFSARYSFASLAYNGRMWVIGGFSKLVNLSDVWSSADGVTWTQVTPTAGFKGRLGPGSLVYNNRMWVIGGLTHNAFVNDVWSSGDGAAWTQAVHTAGFSARYAFGSVVYNNKMWVIGGETDEGDNIILANDVWSSEDGVSWTQVTGTAEFSGRCELGSLVYDNKMWVIGGETDIKKSITAGDAWCSIDGKTWTQVSGAAWSGGRCKLGSLVYNDKMWVIGGWNSSSGYLNDVWWLQ